MSRKLRPGQKYAQESRETSHANGNCKGGPDTMSVRKKNTRKLACWKHGSELCRTRRDYQRLIYSRSRGRQRSDQPIDKRRLSS